MMGREIRRVPPKWGHPCYTEDDAPRRNLIGEYRPCHDQDYETASKEWLENCEQWRRGEHEEQGKEWVSDIKYYWEYESPPDEQHCRPAFIEQPTWFQMYETVTEGTPVTPAFGQKSSLVNWLVERGEMHGTEYECRYTREQAWAFVEQGHAFSMVFTPETGVISGVEYCEHVQRKGDSS